MPESTPEDAVEGTVSDVETVGAIASPEFIASLLADGDDDLAAWAIEQALAEQPRAVVFDDVIRRAMELVGTRWVTGQWSISQEHLATVALMDALARLRPRDPSEARIGPIAVLAAPEGEQHVTGLACLAQILEERGWRAENLGANMPADDLQRFVAGHEVQLVALSIGTRDRLPALRRTVEVLRSGGAGGAGRRVPIMVGGHGTEGVEAEIQDADLVTPSLAEAERFIVDLGERLRQRE